MRYNPVNRATEGGKEQKGRERREKGKERVATRRRYKNFYDNIL